jgi:hypothetical protein
LTGTGVKRGRVDRDEFERSGSAVIPCWYAPQKRWTHIARQLRGRARAEALTVAAVCHTLRGDTVRATIALEIIRDELRAAGATPPALAVLLDEALQHGIHPDRIRDVVAGTLDTPPPAGA